MYSVNCVQGWHRRFTFDPWLLCGLCAFCELRMDREDKEAMGEFADVNTIALRLRRALELFAETKKNVRAAWAQFPTACCTHAT